MSRKMPHKLADVRAQLKAHPYFPKLSVFTQWLITDDTQTMPIMKRENAKTARDFWRWMYANGSKPHSLEVLPEHPIVEAEAPRSFSDAERDGFVVVEAP